MVKLPEQFLYKAPNRVHFGLSFETEIIIRDGNDFFVRYPVVGMGLLKEWKSEDPDHPELRKSGKGFRIHES